MKWNKVIKTFSLIIKKIKKSQLILLSFEIVISQICENLHIFPAVDIELNISNIYTLCFHACSLLKSALCSPSIMHIHEQHHESHHFTEKTIGKMYWFSTI
jgi:hypothetical protein